MPAGVSTRTRTVLRSKLPGWREMPEVFLGRVPSGDELDGYDHVCRLLDRVVAPSSKRRSPHLRPTAGRFRETGAGGEGYVSSLSANLERAVLAGTLYRTALYLLPGDVGEPVALPVASYGDVPYHGGRWGLAVLPDAPGVADLELMDAKMRLARWLGRIPQDVTALAVATASCLDSALVRELDESGTVPVLFDFSGEIVEADPMDGAIVERDDDDRIRHLRFELRAGLTPQAADMVREDVLSAEFESFSKRAAKALDGPWNGLSWDMVEALSFGRERRPEWFPDHGGAGERAWPLDIVDVPASSLGTEADELNALGRRLFDVSSIWGEVLRSYNVKLELQDGPRRRSVAGASPDTAGGKDLSKTQELGRLIGVEAAVNAYYAGVPLDDVLVGV